ncbi:uncharacterized protein UV8b_05270 [Ustilaginoidea virens]|nr:uncharacterized protein UV8b_05270 [Ustilaginoidea virens]QUC21029.1 hypothetical protein UV8b_05270 [Ustilaginoidea virens]
MTVGAEDQSPSNAAASTPANEHQLPPLSDDDFRIYSRMADRMQQFHDYFRQTWNMLYEAASTSRRPPNLTLQQFLSEGISFASHLSAHHAIEEEHIFPLLATRMPEFNPTSGQLVKQHAQIHRGLEEFERYVQKCRRGEVDFEMATLKEKMEGWGGVLWEHLDQEVEMLGAERMRAVWTRDEMKRLPM